MTRAPTNRAPALALAFRIAAFVVIFAVLQAGYGAAAGTWLERLVIDDLTVKVAAAVIQAIDPASGVHPIGSRLASPGGGINVLNGCEGMDVVLLLTSAMLVAPVPPFRRCLGVLAGGMGVLALNQVRVIALFYALRQDKGWFEVLHNMVTPLMLIIGAGAFFVFWLDRYGASGGAMRSPAVAGQQGRET